MPANLTPEYEKADLRYRQAATDEERVAALEEMLATIPKHKGTEKMQADLKHRLSQLRRAGQKAAHAKGPDPFHIPRSGAGQAVLVGLPNSGKSSLLKATTHAEAKVGDYPFTTVMPQPGMWLHDDIPMELVDTPPVTADHVPVGLMGTIRNADVVALVVEAGEDALDQLEQLRQTLRERGVVLGPRPRRAPESLAAGEEPGLVVLSKADLVPPGTLATLSELHSNGGVGDALPLRLVPVSVPAHAGFEELFKALWELMGIIRVYAKEPGKPADLHKPFTVPVGATVADLARQIHRDLPEQMKYARLWGHSRFEGQQVHKTEVLRDRDIVEIHE